MTIDEAIEHAEEIACGNDQCAKDHAQLADWLRELRQVRIDIEVLKIFRDGFKEDAQKYKAENERLRGQLESLRPTDCEGNELNIADTVHMLRSEHDGDHEWDDVVVELALAEWGGDRWIVRGSRGEAWACDCEKTGHDQEAYEASDDADEISVLSLLESENARLRHQLLSIMRGMRDTWCAEHDSLTCKECPMYKDENTCGWTGAYDLIEELGLVDDLYE
jgi:hypothetical protein